MAQTGKKNKGSISSFVGWLLVVCLLGSLLISFIRNQVEIASKRQELTALQEQVQLQLAENTELTRLLEDGTEQEIIERIARDRLGYAKPGERVFVDTSGK